MTNTNVPTWAGSAETLARRVKPIIHLIKLNASIEPSAIDALVKPEGSEANYASKYITFLRKLGYEFTATKQGRKIVAYNCVSVPKNDEDIRNVGPKATKAKAPKAPKTPKAKAAKPAPAKKTEDEKPAKKAAAAKAKNLAKLKQVHKKMKEESEPEVLEDDLIMASEIENDWDSIEGLDLAKLI